MATYLSLVSFLLLTFLLAGSPFSSARDIPSDISLVQEPEESYYLYKRKPAVIVCQARNAADIIFTCMGTQIPPSSVEMEDITDIDPSLIQAKIEVTKADVQNYESAGTPFWCECSAVDINDQLVATSRRTTVTIASLKYKFGLHPMSTTASEGENVEFACAPPVGDPTPEIMWRKDKKRLNLEENAHMLVTDKGSLVIESVTEADAGAYQCVAKNFAGRRESDEAVLTVKVLAEASEAQVELQEQRGTETHRSSGAGKARVARQSTKAFFTSEPQESYYITPGKALTIDCGVTAADILTYRCNGERMDRERQTIDQGMDNAGNRVIQSQLSIAYADVQAFLARAGDGRTYQCQCVAWYQDSSNPRGWGHITSSKDVGVVLLASEAPPTTAAAPIDEDEDFMPSFPAVIPDTPLFLRNFEPQNSLGVDGTKTMICAVVSAEQLSVDCGGQRLPTDAYDLKTDVDQETGKRLLSAKTVVTSASIARSPDDYFCQCTAWYLNDQRTWAMITSVKGYVQEGAASSYIDDDFIFPPESLEVYFEDVAEFACEPPAASPEAIVYWMKDGQRIDPVADPNYVVLEEGPLIVEYVRVKDEGTYTCVAENEAGRRMSPPVTLTVLGKPTTQPEITTSRTAPPVAGTTVDYETDYELTEPLFSVEPTEFSYIVKDEPVTLHCTVVGSKTLVFACNGEVVQETATTGFLTVDPITGHHIRDNELTITREQVEAYDAEGRSVPYTCVCRAFYKKEGSAEGTHDSVESQPGTIQVAYLRRGFAQEPSDTQVAYGESVTLPCEGPDGIPEPDVYWLKDGYRIIEDERVRMEQGSNLFIDEFDEMDEGEYSCIAENLVRQRTSQPARVSLADDGAEPEPEGGKVDPDEGVVDPEPTHGGVILPDQQYGTPYISKDLPRDNYLIKNKDLTLTCEAYSVDYITFSCGMQSVEVKEMTERAQEVPTEDGSIKMVNVVLAKIDVSKSDVESSGMDEFWCQCYAHYTVPGMDDPQVLSSEKGYVQMAYLKKNFQKEPENKVVSEGSFLSIPCIPPIGNPEAKVSWMKDGEKVEALSITPDGSLIFPEARSSHTGQYVCEAENVAGKRSSPPIYVEVSASEGGEGSQGNENVCAQMLTTCSGLIPQNVDHVQYCEAVPDYIACVDNFSKMCMGIINEESMNAVKMAKMHAQTKCHPSCPKLEDCKMIYSNSPDKTMDTTGLPVRNFCEDVNSFLRCVDQTLVDCNVTMAPPEEDVRTSLYEVGNWFTQYCNRMILGSDALANCEEMVSCDLGIGQVAPNNATYWCRLMSTLVECTAGAVNTCGLDELRNDLEELHAQANQESCYDDMAGGHGSWPEGEPKPEGEGEPKPEGEGEVDDDDNDDDDDDDDDDDESPGGIEGKENDADAGIDDSDDETMTEYSEEEITTPGMEEPVSEGEGMHSAVEENEEGVEEMEGEDESDEDYSEETIGEDDSEETGDEDDSEETDYDRRDGDKEYTSEESFVREDKEDYDFYNSYENYDFNNNVEEEYDFNKKPDKDMKEVDVKHENEQKPTHTDAIYEEEDGTYTYTDGDRRKTYGDAIYEEEDNNYAYTDEDRQDAWSDEQSRPGQVEGDVDREASMGEASKEGSPEDGAAAIGASTLLAILSQFLVAAILSRR